MIWPLAHTGIVLYRGLSDRVGDADIGVVFGTGAVSPRLHARISKTLELYQAGRMHRILLTGVARENQFMYDFLRQHQVPAENIMRDDTGYTTYDSLVNLKTYLQPGQRPTGGSGSAQRILVVSQYFHILRIQLAFRLVDLQLDYHAHADLFQWYDLYMLWREFIAYYVYWFRYR